MALKILLVTREYPPFIVGGIATHTLHLNEHLRQLGVDTHVVSFGSPAMSNDDVTFIQPRSSIIARESQGVISESAVPYDIARFIITVRDMLDGERYDVVHVQEPYVAGLLTAKNKVTTIHDTGLGELNSIMVNGMARKNIARAAFFLTLGLAMEYASIANSRAIIVPSEQVGEELVTKYRADRNKLHMIMNGVEPTNRYLHLSKQEAKAMLGVSDGKRLVFTTGQHVARKRLDVLLEACQLLGRKGILDSLSIRIGGQGPLTDSLVSQAASLGLNGSVNFVGWLGQEELELYYRAADIFVISSDYEAGPITMLEAMVAGTPTLSTRILGFPSLSLHKGESFLVPRRDPHAMADAIECLTDDQDLSRRIAGGGANFARRFTWENAAKQTLKLYERMVMTAS